LGYLALAACEAELARAEAQRKADYEHQARMMGNYAGEGEYSGSGGGPGMPGMPGRGMPGMPGGGMPGGGMPGSEGINRTRPQTPGVSGEGGYGGYGGDVTMTNPTEADPKHYQMDYLRRRIRQQL